MLHQVMEIAAAAGRLRKDVSRQHSSVSERLNHKWGIQRQHSSYTGGQPPRQPPREPPAPRETQRSISPRPFAYRPETERWLQARPADHDAAATPPRHRPMSARYGDHSNSVDGKSPNSIVRARHQTNAQAKPPKPPQEPAARQKPGKKPPAHARSRTTRVGGAVYSARGKRPW